ncbi:uncharacterized protein LOC132612650 [Lycium barbarum]|uniref:uncharacterized protein LOC132612650 n=1 Tax=Lycium barbarum TaxID=112863 RepID=UPI00293EECE9|nr:uncharacterized protein LOC132612650 [Lycium barbarum]
MVCVRIVSYSILINRSPTAPFAAKKGVRQGDMSPYLFVLSMEYLTRLLKNLRTTPDFQYHLRCKKLNIIQLSFADDLLLFCKGDKASTSRLYECFQVFSHASGLIENQSKSSIYFGGVPEPIKQSIIQTLGFLIGKLPFKYLGVPLSSKKLTVAQCQPLLEKMLGRITSWTTKFLSYAGRLQLLRSVLIAVKYFWSQMLPLPKKILQKIETVCRKFLWTGAAEAKNKALVAWDQLCWPRTAGGLNITDVHTWNKAAIVKQLWNLSKKKDKLWVMWVHTYYIKGRAAWDVITKQASWLIQKILQAAKYLTEANLDKVTILQADNYSIRDVYNQLRGDYPKVEWRRLICNNHGSPKWIFVLYLAIHCRMYTRDRLDKWGIQRSLLCPLCEVEKEDHQRIFFV